MGSSGVYTFSFSNELRNYYRNYYDVKTTAEMAELTWIGANPGPNPGELYTYNPLAQYSIGSAYILEAPFNGGRIYALVPWRWSQLSLTQKENLPSTWTTSYISPNVPGATPTWGVDYIHIAVRFPLV